MSCKHKFYDDLKLDKLDFNPSILIIGTFNPEWPETNYAQWFYGRTSNNYFWEILPRMFNSESLRLKENKNVKDWKIFCSEKKVAITDLIASIEDADIKNKCDRKIIANFRDVELTRIFDKFEKTDVLKIIKNHSSINKVFFTRNKGVDLFDKEIDKIQKYCQEKKIHFSHLMTPSGNAGFQMRGYMPKNKKLDRNLPNFIFEKWKENWD